MKRFALFIPMLSLGLIVTACDEKTMPAEPSRGSTPPAFDLVSSGGGAVTADGPVQVVNVTHGSDFTCMGTVTGSFDNIVVPPGATCIVTNAMVRGNIKALEDAVLAITLNTTINGSVYGDKADVLQINNIVTIHGNIEMVEGGPHPLFHELSICGTHLPNGNIKIIKRDGGIDISPTAFCIAQPNNLDKGSLQVEDNVIPGKGIFIRENRVAQNLQVYKNLALGSTVMNNIVGQSVQCFENRGPFVGGPNTAPKKEGQCF